MNERRSTLVEVAERIRKSPRWLRDKLKTLPPVGDRFGRTWTFTAAQERTLIALIQSEHEPKFRPGRRKAQRWQGNSATSTTLAALLERLTPAPKARAAKAAAKKKLAVQKGTPKSKPPGG